MLSAAEDAKGFLHPLITLQVSSNKGAPVSSVCFLAKSCERDLCTESSDEGDDDMIFRSQQLQPPKGTAQQSLSDFFLASCHSNGGAYLWDLHIKRIVYTFPSEASGLAMTRVQGNKLAYQTRDGFVSIYDVSTKEKIVSFYTGSKTFCAMAVCQEHDHVLALPSSDKSFFDIHDLRQSADKVTRLHASGGEGCHGMLMSLAIRDSIVVCGMEDGNLFIHNWRKRTFSSLKLSQDFILGLDLAQSVAGRVVAIAGMAGNAEDLKDLPESEQGTVAVVKCTLDPLEATLRCRAGTCSLGGGGKPGVDVGRFRPDGRIFAIGGWDKRVRLLDRRHAKTLGILKGHTESVSTLVWASNSLLASGDKDGTIHVWNVVI
jgi:WD40 repeat protein